MTAIFKPERVLAASLHPVLATIVWMPRIDPRDADLARSIAPVPVRR